MRSVKLIAAIFAVILFIPACQKKAVYFIRQILRNYERCDISKLSILARKAMPGDPQLPDETHLKYYNANGTVRRIRTMYFGLFGDYRIYDLNITYQGFRAFFKGRMGSYDYTNFLMEEDPVSFAAEFDPATGWIKNMNRIPFEYAGGKLSRMGGFHFTYDAKGNILKILDKEKRGAAYTYANRGAGKNLFYAPIRGTSLPDIYWMVDFLGWAPLRPKNERVTFLLADPQYQFDPEKYFVHRYDGTGNLVSYDTESKPSRYQPQLEWNCDCPRNGDLIK